MSDIVSSDNLVNALNSVRDDYHEHLKSIPQYEAFLLIESSAHRVFETLNGLADSPAPAMAGEVISSLEVAKAKFKQHLTSVPEYRALLAIEKLIRDVSIDLGVAEPTPVQTMLATAEHEMPPEPVSIQPEPDLAELDLAEPDLAELDLAELDPAELDPAELDPAESDLAEPDLAESTSGPAVPQPEAVEIAATAPAAETQAEPDLVVSASEPTLVQPEAAVVASDQQIVATQPERDLAVPAFEHTLALATEIASNHAMAQPELDLAALEHAIARTGLAEIAFAGPMTTAQKDHSSDPMPAKQGAASGEPAWDKAPAAIEDLDDFDEPPATAREGGSERAA
jgi:hypothetical protein